VALYYWIIAIVYIGFFARLMIHAMDTGGKNKGFLVGSCIGSTGIIIGLMVESICDILPPVNGVGFLCVHAITASRKGCVLSVLSFYDDKNHWRHREANV
jgi:hypothetical protein